MGLVFCAGLLSSIPSYGHWCGQQVFAAGAYYRTSLSRPLPIVRQNMNGKCGPSSLAIAVAYFGKIFQLHASNPYELSDAMTTAVYQVGMYGLGSQSVLVADTLSRCVLINSAETLASTARVFGLYAKVETAALAQMASHVSNQEVVLVHWTMGTGLEDGHWSAIQEINSAEIHLRDPWPLNPIENVRPLWDFAARSLVATGFFTIVRVSDRPL